MGRLPGGIAQGAKLSPDLDAIAAEEAAKMRPPCWVCGIPKRDRDWVERSRAEGTSETVICRVLVKAGHPKEKATRARLRRHILNCVSPA